MEIFKQKLTLPIMLLCALTFAACSGDTGDDGLTIADDDGGDEQADAGDDSDTTDDENNNNNNNGENSCETDCSELDTDCRRGSCDLATGECTTRPVGDGTRCESDNACLSDTYCMQGECRGTERDCSDLDEGNCVAGVCNPDTGECDGTELVCTAPSGISFSEGEQLDYAGSDTGGDQFDDECPEGQALIGFEATSENSNTSPTSLSAECGEVVWSDSDPLEVDVVAGDSFDQRGTVESTEWETSCPEGHVVVGYEGRDGLLVDQLAFHCAPLEVEDSQYGLSLVVGEEVETSDPIGSDNGSEFDPIACPSDKVATTSHIRTGDALDGFSVTCERPSFEFAN